MKPIVLVDIDGTIALRGDRSPYDHDSSMEDAVNWPIVQLCNVLHCTGRFDIVLITGRDEKYRDVTEYWLDQAHQILSYRAGLYTRPLGDTRPDEAVKREIYWNQIHPKHGRAWLVLDDRNRVVKMWRELGLTCLQVADGNF